MTRLLVDVRILYHDFTLRMDVLGDGVEQGAMAGVPISPNEDLLLPHEQRFAQYHLLIREYTEKSYRIPELQTTDHKRGSSPKERGIGLKPLRFSNTYKDVSDDKQSTH